jgi:hypothetical protein
LQLLFHDGHKAALRAPDRAKAEDWGLIFSSCLLQTVRRASFSADGSAAHMLLRHGSATAIDHASSMDYSPRESRAKGRGDGAAGARTRTQRPPQQLR